MIEVVSNINHIIPGPHRKLLTLRFFNKTQTDPQHCRLVTYLFLFCFLYGVCRPGISSDSFILLHLFF